MAHAQQLEFVRAVASALARDWSGRRVLEIGAYDVNGSIRGYFAGSRYTGVDLVEGPGVDLVGDGHAIAFPEGSFDLSVSCECFEHDPNWFATFMNMYRSTAPGGALVFTCASRGRPEHGTRRTKPTSSPGTQSIGSDYYRNLTAADFRRRAPLDRLFSSCFFHYNPPSADLYFCGVKAGRDPLFERTVDEVRASALQAVAAVNRANAARQAAARSDRPVPRRWLSAVAQWPVKAAALLPDPWYQDFRFAYDGLKKRAAAPFRRAVRGLP
ncbi:MAG: class I SAM-dependent methyltransferase [Acetobacteraceae bacterium]|nr:class I SAM-dependent methyltransferase [Acetobacteraceae bacterium]